MIADELTLIVPCKGADCEGTEALHAVIPCRLHLVQNRRYGEAIQQGIYHSTTPYLATMDADGQHSVSEVLHLYRTLRDRRDEMVIGVRTARPRGLRSVASACINLTASILAGQHVEDCGSGLRVFTRDLGLELLSKLPDGFDFNAVFTLLALQRGARVSTMSITVAPRRHGRSHVRWTDGLRTLVSLARCRATQ